MEKIKNILKPGRSQDDETLYGTGQSTGASHPTQTHSGGLTGEGSHLGDATKTSQTTNPTLAGSQQSPVVRNNALGATGGQTTQPGNHMGQGSASGTHSSNLSDRADTRVDSDNSKYATQPGQEAHASKSGLGNAQIGGSSIGQSALSGLTGGSTGSNILSGNTHTPLSSQHIPGEWVDETDTSRYTETSTPANKSSDSHTARGTTALGAAGVAGSGVHSQRVDEKDFGSTTGSSDLAQTFHAVGDPSYTQGTNSSTDHHLGRDAAIVGGAGVGAAAIGAGLSSTQHTGSQGPHITFAANQLDPAVNTRASGHEDGIHHSPIHGGGAEEADHHHGGTFSESAAALGRGPGQPSQQQTDRGTGFGLAPSTGPAPHTVGPHQQDIANVLDPRVNPSNAAGQAAQDTSQTTSHSTVDSSGHHYGRDAAIGAGVVGAAGLAGSQYQSTQSRSDIGTSNAAGNSGLSSGPAPNTAGPHKSDMLNRADPRVIANPTVAQGNPQAQSVLGLSDKSHASTGGYATQPSDPHQKDYNYGKDAALAGGVTSAFLAGQHHGQSGTADPSLVGQHGASTTSQDPYSASSTQRSTIDPNTDRLNDHHLGRDAAIAGGVADVGGAAYGVDKHHEKELAKAQREAEKEQKQDLRQAEKDHKHEVKRAEKQAEKDHKKDLKAAEKDEKHQEKKKHGFLSFLHRDKSKKYSPEEEADFERQEREHNATHVTPLPEKPAGTDIGDKLHGADRNRGVTGAAGFPNQPGFGDGTTGHQHLVSEATTDQHGRPVGSGTLGVSSQHSGREFPLGHSKHDSGYTEKTSPPHPITSQQSGLTSSPGQSGLSGNQSSSGYQSVLDPGRQQYTSTSQQDYHQQQHATSGYQAGRDTSELGSSITQQHEPSTGSKTSDLSGRNRLHKDPPAHHPAAQAQSGNDSTGSHVPASGSERDRLVEQGKNDLDRNTGVANAPPANFSSNY
ncbi:hypothetical protein IFR05_011692 [Cadophora sp. M221]|nr:hypothetical protein IFR05_011692 [Cadophora sp. M221]